MSKKKRKDKELARLRREVEVLRAQVGRQEPKATKETEVAKAAKGLRSSDYTPPKHTVSARQVDPIHIKKDLLKSGILTVIACAIVGGLYIFRARIPFL